MRCDNVCEQRKDMRHRVNMCVMSAEKEETVREGGLRDADRTVSTSPTLDTPPIHPTELSKSV
jgi:hypothetical protein